MNIALFGLTGLGNSVFRSLTEMGAPPSLVVTREEPDSYPYYSELNLSDEVRSAGIPVGYSKSGELQVLEQEFDLLIVCTYHRILREKLIKHFKFAVNIHPSLLPAYRGASPFYWVIRNNETRTGVTAHELQQEADAGDIILQRAIEIAPAENQGSLRLKLAHAAGLAASDVVNQILRNGYRTVPQQDALATSYPRVTDAVREIDKQWSPDELDRHLRALAPFPGALFNGKELPVEPGEALEIINRGVG